MTAMSAKVRLPGVLLAGLIPFLVGLPLSADALDAATSAPSAPADLPSSLPLLADVKASAPSPLEQPFPGLLEDTHLDKTPARKTTGLDLVKLGWSYDCMECHQFLEARWHYGRPMVEHQDINLQHGNNRFCLNCHHPTNRNAFVDYDGSQIAEQDVVLLCAKCHGPTYRDWKSGVHGRRNGFWNTSRGSQTQLRCIQCHDPHSPAFQPMNPLPPPRYPERAPDTRTAHTSHGSHSSSTATAE